MGSVPVLENPIKLASTEDGEDQSEETDKANTREMDTQKPQPSEAIKSSPQYVPMDIKQEEQKTLPQISSGPSQGNNLKHDTTVTRHTTRPLRERRPPTFLVNRLFTSVVTGGATNVNVVRQTQNTSDDELERVSKSAACVTPKTVNRNGGESNVLTSTAYKAKKPTQISPKKIPSPKRRSAKDT